MECRYRLPRRGEECRYLNETAFLELLKRNFKIDKIPYKLTIKDLLLNKAIEPSLLVRLPECYFENWGNYPLTPAKYLSEQTYEEKLAHQSGLNSQFRSGDFNMEFFLHPYDSNDKECKDFIYKFKSESPEVFEVRRHSNGEKYSEYEAYLNYYTGYILAEALSGGYENIGLFLSKNNGKDKLFKQLQETCERWRANSFFKIFDRLSYYITAMSLWHHYEEFHRNKMQMYSFMDTCSFMDVAKFISEKINYSHEEMEEDMGKLVGRKHALFQQWNIESEKDFLYKPAVEMLRRDIYFLLQWMCSISGKTTEYFFENKWPKHETQRGKWNPKVSYLNDALEYEDFDLKDRFVHIIPLYIENIPERIVPKEENERYKYLYEIYERLAQYDEFKPWNRAFNELHKSLDMNGHIDFKQTRIIDYLLIITIRTEIIVRAYCKERFEIKDRDLKNIFCKLASKFNECRKENSLFCIIYEEFNKLTELSGTPEKIFDKIEEYPKKRTWNNEILSCFKTIMRFVTARNYFAHHCYKDDEVNENTSDTAGKIITSCIETIFIIDKATQGQCFL